MDEILTPEQWYELKGRIKKLYPELTETDLQYHEAVEQDMLTMVAYSLRKTKEIMLGILANQYHLSPLKNYWRYSRKSHIRQKTE
ncbi:MAG: hypothetical protein WC780_13680 [Lentimicrobiaceae bacterium]|jgi:hypothetical protein